MDGLTPASLVTNWLHGFFETQQNFDTLYVLLNKQKTKQKNVPSLRVLEHLVTSFSRTDGFAFKLPHADIPMHLYDAYQAELRRHGKVLFDIFAREDKQDNLKHVLESPDGDGRTLTTTAKQMNFVRWAIVNNVVDYAITNLQAIKANLPSSTRAANAAASTPKPRVKRQRTAFACPPKVHTGDFKLSFKLPVSIAATPCGCQKCAKNQG